MIGKVVVVLVCLTAAILSIPAASWTGLSTWGSLAASSTAFTAMALNLFLATRPRVLERAFGGLDQIYGTHRALGITALSLVLIHYIVTPNFKGIDLTSDLNALAKDVGQVAFFTFVLLATLSLLKRVPFTRWVVPYQWWRQSHRLMGGVFLLVAFHQFFIKRPFTGDVALVGYLTFFAILGTLSFAYAELAPLMKRRRYLISDVVRLPSATLLEARPIRRALRIKPGQFAFLSIGRDGLGEPHPFTVAGRNPDGTVRFIIKPSGDYTKRLRESVAIGDRVKIEGGYGRFSHTRGGRRQVWLAGGIGITPFLAMAESLSAEETREIHLIHCVSDKAEALGADLIAQKTGLLKSFTYRVHESAAAGRLDAAAFRRLIPFDIAQTDLWYCGPARLRQAIVNGLKRDGLRFRRVEFERFEFR